MKKAIFVIGILLCCLYSFSQDYQEKLPGEWTKWITVYEDSMPGAHHKIQISFNLANCGQADYRNFNNGESYYRVKSDFKIPKSAFIFSFIFIQCDTTEITEEVTVDLHKPLFDDARTHHFAGHAVKTVSLTGKAIPK